MWRPRYCPGALTFDHQLQEMPIGVGFALPQPLAVFNSDHGDTARLEHDVSTHSLLLDLCVQQEYSVVRIRYKEFFATT